MKQPTFKEFVAQPELYESDENRLMQLRKEVARGTPGATKKMDDLVNSLRRRNQVKGIIALTVRDYETWKKNYTSKNDAQQRKRDQDFATAKSMVQAKDDPDQGSEAFRKETGSIRRTPKGTVGTSGTIPTR